MRKIFLSILGLGFLITNAQQLRQEDGLRYAIQDLTGTARYRAMSGAFGALGGDLSALNVNPAGSVFFNNNFASVTGSSFNTKNSATYFGSKNDDSNNSLSLNQIGAVFVFKDKSGNSDWKKISLALNYENTNDYRNSIFISGTNPSNTIGNYFLNFAQGIPVSDLSNLYYEDFDFVGQQAYLGYQTYLFDHNDSNPNTYTSNVPSGQFYQKNSIITTGNNSKVTGNFATSYKDKIFFGGNLNAHFTDYIRTTNLYESNNNNPSLGVQSIAFDNKVYTYGTGFSFNLGAIAKITESFRVGAAYESPTWYRLNDELTQSIDSYSTDGTNNYHDYLYPNTTNIYPTYKLQTPGKLTASAAYIFGNSGLLSLDVSRKDYNQTKFGPKKEQLYQDLNIGIGNSLTDALEFRLGGELKHKQWSFRGGYRYEQSPYANGVTMGDLTGYSGGLGYNFGKNRLDLAYAYAQRDYNQYLISSGMNDTARIKAIQNNITLSYSVNF